MKYKLKSIIGWGMFIISVAGLLVIGSISVGIPWTALMVGSAVMVLMLVISLLLISK